MNLPKHLYGLDITRGIAAAAVVFWHWQHFYMNGAGLPPDFDRTQQPLYALFSPFYEHGHRAVPFFFELSGFVFFWLYRDKVTSGACSLYQFAALRFARLYPLHLVTLVSVLALQMVHARVNGGYFVYPWNDAYHLALHAGFISNWGFERGFSFNAPVWSVSIEIGLYCLFVIYCMVRLPHAFKLISVLVIAVALMIWAPTVPWSSAILAFFIGGVTYEFVNAYRRCPSKVVDTLMVMTAIAAWAGVLMSDPLEKLLLTQESGSLLFLFPLTISALVVAEMSFPSIPRRVAWIGNLTYSSYLLHFPLQLAFVLVAQVAGYRAVAFSSPFVLMAFMLSLAAVSLVTYYRFEKPAQDWIRSRMLASQSAAVIPGPQLASGTTSMTPVQGDKRAA